MKVFASTTLSLLFLLLGQAIGQNKITGYEYWFDSDPDNVVSETIEPTEAFSFEAELNTDALVPGPQTFNIRFLDDSARYSPVVSRFFLKPYEEVQGATSLVQHKYWFDNSYEEAVIESITSGELYSWEGALDASGLLPGLHTIHFMTRDNLGKWGSPLSAFFMKESNSVGDFKELTATQYWIDDDFENAVTESIAPAQYVQFNPEINLESLQAGIHTIHFRFMDNSGKWSSPLSVFIMKENNLVAGFKELTATQYWIDDDFENAVTESIAPAQYVQFNPEINLESLQAGIHTIQFRFMDNSGKWSSPVCQFFYKGEEPNTDVVEITRYRYWFDDGNNTLQEYDLTPSMANVTLNDLVDMTQVWKGEHLVHFQFRDTRGVWSSITTDTVEKLSLPIAAFEYESYSFCDSMQLTMFNQSIDGDVYLWDFGDGTQSTEIEPVHSYLEPGEYTITLTATDTLLWSDSTATETIIFEPENSFATLDETVCDSYVSPSGNYTWTSSGTYHDTLTNTMGCDSILTINLIVLEASAAVIDATECDSYTSPSGNYLWTSSGTYNDTLNNAMGCDSIITINLTILESSYASIDESACNSYTSPSGNYLWTSSGTYFDTIPNIAGCDSSITINLSIIVVDTAVTNTDPILTANVVDAEYQWMTCPDLEPIEGAVDQSYTATENGSYAVEITQEGCVDTSSCHLVVSVGVIQNNFGDGFSVYPNPTKGKVVVALDQLYSNLSVVVRNSKGSTVLGKHHESSNRIEIDLLGAPGLYFIEVREPGGRSALIKVMKE